jgi:hypothetical protein
MDNSLFFLPRQSLVLTLVRCCGGKRGFEKDHSIRAREVTGRISFFNVFLGQAQESRLAPAEARQR